MQKRKKGFIPQFSTFERRRIARRFARTQQLTKEGTPKKPLAELFTIASPEERTAALKKGKMVFYNGKERIELPLVLVQGECRDNFCGIFKIGKRIIVFRRMGTEPQSIVLFELTKKNQIIKEKELKREFFRTTEDLGHMELEKDFRGHGLGIKGALIAEKNIRAKQNGEHKFRPGKDFVGIFKKLRYNYAGSIEPKSWWDNIPMKKTGKFQPKDNLDEWFSFEAIDPKNGKAKIFRYPRKK